MPIPLEFPTHWNTKRFEVWISNSLVLEWLVIAKAIAMESEQNGDHFVSIFNGLGQKGCHFVQNRLPLKNQTKDNH